MEMNHRFHRVHGSETEFGGKILPPFVALWLRVRPVPVAGRQNSLPRFLQAKNEELIPIRVIREIRG